MKDSDLFRLTRPAPKIVERHVVEACLNLVQRRNYWPARLHAGRFKTLDDKRWITGVAKGTPDYAALHPIYPGFLLELKRPGGDLRLAQEQKIFELQHAYHLAVAVCDSVITLEMWLDEHEKKARARWREHDTSNRAS